MSKLGKSTDVEENKYQSTNQKGSLSEEEVTANGYENFLKLNCGDWCRTVNTTKPKHILSKTKLYSMWVEMSKQESVSNQKKTTKTIPHIRVIKLMETGIDKQ